MKRKERLMLKYEKKTKRMWKWIKTSHFNAMHDLFCWKSLALHKKLLSWLFFILFDALNSQFDGNTRAFVKVLWPYFVCCMNRVTVSCRWRAHIKTLIWTHFSFLLFRIKFEPLFFGGLIHFKIYFSAWVRWLFDYNVHAKPVCFTFSARIMLLWESLHVW